MTVETEAQGDEGNRIKDDPKIFPGISRRVYLSVFPNLLTKELIVDPIFWKHFCQSKSTF